MDAKMICSYFGAVTKEPIYWNNQTILPKPLVISEMIFRGFTCPTNCGACCLTVSTLNSNGTFLEYLPHESRSAHCQDEVVVMNGKSFTIKVETMHASIPTILPVFGAVPSCKHLTMEGRCGIYRERSLGCDLPLLQVRQYKSAPIPYNLMGIAKFGRGQGIRRKGPNIGQEIGYRRVDGGRGTKCELLSITHESTEDTRRRFRRLKEWTDYFEINTWLPEILEWANREPLPTQKLRLGF